MKSKLVINYLRSSSFLFLCFLCFSFRAEDHNLLHDFHTSLTEINYNPSTKSVEMSIHIFTDDLETALKTKINNNTKADALIAKYVQEHFGFLNAQNQKTPLEYIGKELEGDATWIYVESPLPYPINTYSLQNKILFEFFNDQTNLVNIKYLAQKKTLLFKQNKTIHKLEF